VQADPLEILWLLAHTKSPVLSYDQFMEIAFDTRQAILAAGLLKEGRPSRCVECDGCEDGHVEEVEQIEYPDGKRRFFIPCPECTCVEVDPKRLRQWVPDYGKVAELLYQSLNCKGAIQTLMPQELWNIGRSPLAGQSRPVWVARTLTDFVKKNLPSGKQAILFVIFPNYNKIDCFDPDRVFQISRLVYIENGQLKFDIEAVSDQLESFVEQLSIHKKPKRRQQRATTIDTLKKAIRKEIYSRKSLLLQNWNTELPPPRQKYFAEMLDISQASIYRALKDNDKELEILWNIVNDPEKIIDYSGF
jgi:hypothetical protein